jgi:hypothetical protein
VLLGGQRRDVCGEKVVDNPVQQLGKSVRAEVASGRDQVGNPGLLAGCTSRTHV